MIRRQKTLINLLKKRIHHRNTKSLSYQAIREKPLLEVINDMDQFFADMRHIQDQYTRLRSSYVRNASIILLRKMFDIRKRWPTAITSIRTFRDAIPKFERSKNLAVVKELVKKGYEEEAIAMCEELGVKYSDFFAPRPVHKKVDITKSGVSKKIIKIIELSNPVKKPAPVEIYDGEKKYYYLHINKNGKFKISVNILSKKLWLVTHGIHCVSCPPQPKQTFVGAKPEVGQFVSVNGNWMQIVSRAKRDFTKYYDKENERVQKAIAAEKKRLDKAKEEKKAKDAILKAERLKQKKKEYAKTSSKRRKAKRALAKKQKELEAIAEAQRLKKEQNGLSLRELVAMRPKRGKFGVKHLQ